MKATQPRYMVTLKTSVYDAFHSTKEGKDHIEAQASGNGILVHDWKFSVANPNAVILMFTPDDDADTGAMMPVENILGIMPITPKATDDGNKQ